jgi:zinc transport system ATP-binding protein
MPSVVDFTSVSFAYGSQPVLRDATFSVKELEYVALIGPNGGGKTTALKLLLGLLSPDQGRIRLTPPLVKVGYVPQTPHYDPAFPISALEVALSGCTSRLSWYGRRSAVDKAAAVEALDRVGMAPYAPRHFGSLSGGQKQRVLIARALAGRPQLLVLDEPTAHVDSEAEEVILSLLDNLKGSITLMMVTHDFEQVVPRVDRLLCFRGDVTSLKPSEVCGHFAMGLYHEPKRGDKL